MKIPDNLKQEILDYAKKQEPREMCGFVVLEGGEKVFYPCPNIADDPENYFEIEHEEWIMTSEIGEIIAVVHSHPNGLPYLSTADRMCQIRCATAFWLVADNEILQFRPVPALLGRNFINYHQDCSQLVLDAYMLAGLDFGKPKPPAGYDFEWFESGQSLIEENLVRLGFEKLTEEPAQLGDVVLLKICSPVPNHAGIYLGDQTMLHHSVGRLSARVPYDGAWLRSTHSIWRHKQWRQLHFTAILNDLLILPLN